MSRIMWVIRYELGVARQRRRLRREQYLWGTDVPYRHSALFWRQRRLRLVDPPPPLRSFVVPTGQPRLPE